MLKPFRPLWVKAVTDSSQFLTGVQRGVRIGWWQDASPGPGCFACDLVATFKNPNLLNQNEKVNRKDIKNPYFSLARILPISLHMDRTKPVSKDLTYDVLHFDYREKYIQAEHDLVLEKTSSKEYHRITDISLGKSGGNPITAVILKNYNDGRHGGWTNYCCYNNKSLVGSYV